MKIKLFLLLNLSVAGCSWGMPTPTKKAVNISDIAGKWEHNLLNGKKANLNIKPDGTYTVLFEKPLATKTGTWVLNKNELLIKPYWHTSLGKIESGEYAQWYITDQYTNILAPFGGDSPDPDQWEVFRKTK